MWKGAQRRIAWAGIMDESLRKIANSYSSPNVMSQRFDAEFGIAKCGSFDSVWPPGGPNVAQDDRRFYIANFRDRTLETRKTGAK